MKSQLISVVTVMCLLIFSACQQAGVSSTDLTQVKAEIQALEDAWADALNAKDLDALMALYTDDAVSMADNAAMKVGKDAIRKDQEMEFASQPEGMTYSFETLDVYGNTDMVTETGTSTYKDANGKVIGTGKYMVVWKKQGDDYLCFREIYNNDTPPEPSAERSIHLFDLPEGVTETAWMEALNEINSVISELGYPGAGYYMYKDQSDETKDYRYYFEGVWPSKEVYTKIHEDPTFMAATEKLKPLHEKIKAVEIYRKMSRI